ncbi:uncharacterized protein RAG0_15373 [Rhynchosporium agropyri]|uniref:Uncharacterized protein n=1 Tax=Rhynchosporium agropyri TaxID=914238 RepID=A0A1E1LKT8_9HELO|nr:uncharacterized protein RAG0_15373 [Rhynchosporium agropyri]
MPYVSRPGRVLRPASYPTPETVSLPAIISTPFSLARHNYGLLPQPTIQWLTSHPQFFSSVSSPASAPPFTQLPKLPYLSHTVRSQHKDPHVSAYSEAGPVSSSSQESFVPSANNSSHYHSNRQINHPSISRADSTPHSLRRSTHDGENDIHVDVTPTAVIEERLRATARALEEVPIDVEQYVWKEKEGLKPSPPAKSLSLDTMHSAGSGWNKKN